MIIRTGDGTVLRREASDLWVAGAGKAAAAMASAVARLLPSVPGVVIAPRGRRRSAGRVRILAGDHPVPGRASFASTRRLLTALDEAPRDATVLFLLSGGTSALLAAPADGITAADKIAVNRHLLRCGAPIEVMNAVRKHLSAVKGGRLAWRAAPREVIALVLSDVPGNDLATIGSGPTVPDPTDAATALRLLRRTPGAAEAIPARVWRLLETAARDRSHDTPKPGDRRLRRSRAWVIGDNRTALDAAAEAAARLGYRVAARRRRLRGEAADCARDLVATLPRAPRRPTCVLAGGETFVTAGRSPGRGGRCQEMALAAAAGLVGTGWTILFAGTDGIDGATDAAGGFCDGTTLRRAGRRRLDVALARHDSHPLLVALDDAFRPGPTGTNVMDLAIALHPGARTAAVRTRDRG